MEIIERLTWEQLMDELPLTERIFYGSNTCWWTHRRQDLYQHPANGLPCGPRGEMLFEERNPTQFLLDAQANAQKFGRHRLAAFMAAHYMNCVVSLLDMRATSSPVWEEYNLALDRMFAREKERKERIEANEPAALRELRTPEIDQGMQDLFRRSMQIDLPGMEAMLLVGALQLVQRHPNLPAASRSFVENFCAGLEQWLKLDPRLTPLVDLGRDARFDVAMLPEAVSLPGQMAETFVLLSEDEHGAENIVVVQDEDSFEFMVGQATNINRMRNVGEALIQMERRPKRIVRYYGREVIEEILP